MKIVKQLCSLLLVLAVCLPCGAFAGDAAEAADGFVFFGGITWETTMQQAQEMIGEVDEEDFFTNQHEEWTTLGYLNQMYNDESIAIVLDYQGEQLVTAACFYSADTSEDFSARLYTLTAELGETTDTSKADAAAAFSAIGRGAFDESQISNLASWILADGTTAYLMDTGGSISLYFLYQAPKSGGE